LYNEEEVDKMMKKVEGHKAIIFDLRGNPGGYAEMLQYLAGYFFDHEVKIAEFKSRKPMKPSIAKPRGKNVFTGKMVLLVDAQSASAAEIFSRLMQIEKRGVVVGDQSSGSVMLAEAGGHDVGLGAVALYGASVTVADVIMTDGNSLEKV